MEKINSSRNKPINDKKISHESISFFIRIAQNDTIILIKYIENFGSTRLQRFIILFSFFIVITACIYLFSKIFSGCKVIKYRHKKYGYYLSARYEIAIYNFLVNQFHKLKRITYAFKLLIDKLAKIISDQSAKKRKSGDIESIQTLLKDIGHENKVFEVMSEEEDHVCVTEKLSEKNDLINDRKNVNFNLIQTFFEKRRTNSLKYKRFKNDHTITQCNSNDDFSILKNSKPIHPNKFRSLKHFRSSDRIILSPMRKWMKSQGDLDTQVQSSKASNVSINILPTILITDTSKMTTDVLDLETFEPNKRA